MNIVIAKLLCYSFEQAGWSYAALTEQEQAIVGSQSVLDEVHEMTLEEFDYCEEDYTDFCHWLHETR
jgi:hypothetical protein